MKNSVSLTAKLGGVVSLFGGIFWIAKAGSILSTGYQPLYIFEIGQALFALGVLGLYARLPHPKRLAKIGAWVAGIGFVSQLGATVYEYLPGAIISTGEEFGFPYSLFVLIGAAGWFVGLPLVGIEIWQKHLFLSPWHAVPILSAVLFIPIAFTGMFHIEIPILLMGFVWMLVGYTLLISVKDPTQYE